MKRTFLLNLLFCASLIALVPNGAAGFPIDVTSGTTGQYVPSQSFNETRGVDVTVLSEDLLVSSMTLNGLRVGGDGTAAVGARIYASPSGVLLASNDTVVFGDGSVTIPISATLVSGQSYRICFFCGPLGEGEDNSGTLFDPAPSGSGGFPYVDSTGSFRINQAYSVHADAYPTNVNIFDPWIVVEADRAQSGVGDVLAVAALAEVRPASPNPFRSSTTILLELRRSAALEAAVIDPSGREIRRLMSPAVAVPGRRTIIWDGNDQDGRPAVAGVYFIRVVVGGTTSVSRVQLLR